MPAYGDEQKIGMDPAWADATIYTIGHSTRSREELVDLLHSFGVVTLVDVRTMPRSRRNPHSIPTSWRLNSRRWVSRTPISPGLAVCGMVLAPRRRILDGATPAFGDTRTTCRLPASRRGSTSCMP